jgi:hypothetical protein
MQLDRLLQQRVDQWRGDVADRCEFAAQLLEDSLKALPAKGLELGRLNLGVNMLRSAALELRDAGPEHIPRWLPSLGRRLNRLAYFIALFATAHSSAEHDQLETILIVDELLSAAEEAALLTKTTTMGGT